MFKMCRYARMNLVDGTEKKPKAAPLTLHPSHLMHNAKSTRGNAIKVAKKTRWIRGVSVIALSRLVCSHPFAVSIIGSLSLPLPPSLSPLIVLSLLRALTRALFTRAIGAYVRIILAGMSHRLSLP